MDHLEPTQPRASDESPKSGEHGKQDHDEPTMADTKQDEKTHDGVGIEEIPTEPTSYTEAEYKHLKRKVDRYLLPLMWLCYGIQSTDKTSLGTQATFGLREDTHLVGQQYAWLTTAFYIAYMTFEFPSNFLLQRYSMGRLLSLYMIAWGIVVLCVGFANNFTQLLALRTVQGALECCVTPGFILVIGSWYTTREHASRSLVFESSIAGFGVLSSLVLYAIGNVQTYRGTEFQAWRYMSYFFGSLTILTGCLCLLLLGTPSEVRWLSKEERVMANTRILGNNTGYDRTGVKRWKWEQARECLRDACFWFAGLNTLLATVPSGGLTTFGALINTSFGFTNLQVILLDIPRSAITLSTLLAAGLSTSRWKNLRLYFMMGSTVPPFIGFLIMSLLPADPSFRWTKYGAFVITGTLSLSHFLAWTLIPSNTAGRTKRTLTSSWTFVCYCVGNMCGSQIFRSEDAPRYVKGIVACAFCFAIQFAVIACWRIVLVVRNRKRRGNWAVEGLSEEERERRGRVLGQKDVTDFENPYFLYSL